MATVIEPPPPDAAAIPPAYPPPLHSPSADSPSGGLAATVGWALAELAGSRRALRAVLHPLGFLCLPLRRSSMVGVGICVHVWADEVPDAELTTSPIHSHSWDLHSRVLFGLIGNARVGTELVPPHQASHRIYQIESAQGADRVIATSQFVRCTRVETQYATAGEEYKLLGGEFHTTVVAGGLPAATVLVARTLADSRDRSLGPINLPGHAESWQIQRRLADSALSRKAVEAVLDRIPTPRSTARPGEHHAAFPH